jgi:hypothetical protein
MMPSLEHHSLRYSKFFTEQSNQPCIGLGILADFLCDHDIPSATDTGAEFVVAQLW